MFYTFYQKYGNSILIRYKSGDRTTQTKVIKDYKPSLYIQADGDSSVDKESIFGYDLTAVQFDTMNEARDWGNNYKDVDGFVIEGNADYANQYIIELNDGQIPDYDPRWIRTCILDIEVDAPEFPEPDEHKYPITAICNHDNWEDEYHIFFLEQDGRTFDQSTWSDGRLAKLKVIYHGFDNEEDLLRSYLIHMKEKDYDLTCGWNSKLFDMPYIVNRCYELVGEGFTKKQLSPFGRIEHREVKDKFGGEKTVVDIVGQPHLDYQDLYEKHNYEPRESYSLDFISYAELKEKKLSYEEEGSLADLYRIDPNKYAEYNVKDVWLIVELDKKLALFGLTYTMAYLSLCNFDETLGTVKIWEKLIAKSLFNTNRAPLFRKKFSYHFDIEGGYVKPPTMGIQDWVVAYDLKSLYPHIEMQYNIGIETFVPKEELPGDLAQWSDKYTIEDILEKRIDMTPVKEAGLAMAANFEFFRKDRMSFFSEIKRDLYAQRSTAKGGMLGCKSKLQVEEDDKVKDEIENEISKLNNVQMGLKILLNGGYGAVANKHFLYFKIENAEAITTSGQLINRWVGEKMEPFLNKAFGTKDANYWVYADTDSGYYCVDQFVKKALPADMPIQKKVDSINMFCEQIMAPEVARLSEDMCEYVNGYEQMMIWEREVIAEKALWTAKKRYIMIVLDNEGVRYKKPQVKIQGLEAIKSSTPEWARNYLEKLYECILKSGELATQQMLAEMRTEFKKFDIHQIAIPRGVKGILKYTNPDPNVLIEKKCPKHTRGAIVHNRMIDKGGHSHIKKLDDGDKIKYVALRLPNPSRWDVIAFKTFMPHEFGLDKFVDRKAVFELGLVDPLKNVLNTLNWSHEEIVTLF